MKKSDIEKIRNAFDIPEPECKEEFLSIHGEKFVKKSPAVSRPLKFRYVPVFAMAAVLIGLWGYMKPDISLLEKPGKDNIIIESTDETPTIVTTTAAVSSVEGQIYTTTAAAQTETKQAVSATAVVTVGTAHIPENAPKPEVTEVPELEQIPPEATAVPHITTLSVNDPPPATAVTKTTAKKTSSAAVTSAVTTAGTTNTVTTSYEQNRVTTVPPLIPDDDEPNVDDENDLRVTPDTVYTKTDKIYRIENGDVNASIPPTPTDADCDLFIKGKVVDVIYTKAKNRPYTQLDIFVTDIMTDKGKLSVCCMISVYVPGGYMPSDEYFAIYPDRKPYDGDYTVYDSAGIDETPEIGDVYRFFLDRGGDGIPDGAYVLASENPVSMNKI